VKGGSHSDISLDQGRDRSDRWSIPPGLLFVEKAAHRFRQNIPELCALNAVGWAIVLLPWSNKGHSPTVLVPIAIFWLLNFILLPVIGLLLWICRNDRHERKSYVATVALYLALNITVLYIVPFISLVAASFLQ
jgi:hypothetical protein